MKLNKPNQERKRTKEEQMRCGDVPITKLLLTKVQIFHIPLHPSLKSQPLPLLSLAVKKKKSELLMYPSNFLK